MVEPLQQLREIGRGEAPGEGLGDALVVLLEAEEARPDIRERREVVGRERLALHDREVDLDLVESAGMDRRVHRHEVRVGRLEPADAGGAAMRRAVVQNPEGVVGVPVRGLGHDLGDEAVEGGDPGRGLAAAKRWPRSTSSAARQTQAPPACIRVPPGLAEPNIAPAWPWLPRVWWEVAHWK